ncbi:MAG TPA: hypothetical protein VK824_06340 [Planctomycetota bacterium]|nr:hypothetical protein [Planctomycetota bacterium]
MSREPSPERPAPPFLREALGYLTGEGRRHTAADLLEGLYARFRVAGREKLADLIYEMSKACLAALPDFSVRTLLHSEPRAPEVISGELGTLSDCLAGVDEPADLGAIARRRPDPPAALTDAEKCLAMLGRLEGDSGRQQLALALCAIHEGRAARAEGLLRELLARADERPEILRIAEVNLAFALLRQERHAEVLPLARAAIAKSPDDPVPWFNLLAASAELHDRPAFEEGLAALRALHARAGGTLITGWVQRDLTMLGRLAGLSDARIAELGTLPDPAPGAGSRGDARGKPAADDPAAGGTPARPAARRRAPRRGP